MYVSHVYFLLQGIRLQTLTQDFILYILRLCWIKVYTGPTFRWLDQ